MSVLKKLLLLLFVLLSTEAYAQWEEVYRSDSYIFDELYFVDNDLGFAVYKGYDQFFRTTDGFETQKFVAIPKVYSIQEMNFFDSLKGFVLGQYDNLHRTTDGGESWSVNLLDIDQPQYLKALAKGGPNTVYVAGRKLLRSTNNGSTWEEIADYTDFFAEHDETMYERESIISFSLENRSSNLFISNYSVYKTQDGGKTLTPVPLPIEGKNVLSHHFISSYVYNNSIYILSDSRGVPTNLFVSHDYGDTWVKNSLPVNTYTHINGINEDTLFITGNEGVLLKSTDGWDSWNSTTIDPDTRVNHVTFTENKTGYLVTDRKIYRNTQFQITTSNKFENAETASQIQLNQNYPNPFNPTTNIQFSLSEASTVEISIYDLLGRKVDMLFQGAKSSGSYTLTFDASNLSGGVYFYEVKTNQSTRRKMMTLIK